MFTKVVNIDADDTQIYNSLLGELMELTPEQIKIRNNKIVEDFARFKRDLNIVEALELTSQVHDMTIMEVSEVINSVFKADKD